MIRLVEQGHDVVPITRATPIQAARAAIASCTTLFHLAGVNRSDDPATFMRDNASYSEWVTAATVEGRQHPLVVFSSSGHATEDSDYGRSKLAAEEALMRTSGKALVSIWRLPHVFGKWARPHYNSVVATFCHECARGRSIRIDDPAVPLMLVHIDDLIDDWIALLADPPVESGFATPRTVWHSNVGDLAAAIQTIADDWRRGWVGHVSSGLQRALYTTFMSYLPTEDFVTELTSHRDERGAFGEILKSRECGQISFLTAHPGITRGGHYHHSKVEKFVVVHGRARFHFRQIATGETHEIIAGGDTPQIVETVPGWAHDITNIGADDLVVLIWSNEPFDPERPDTVPQPL